MPLIPKTKHLNQICFNVENGKLVLKTSHAYYFQIQYQLGVLGLDWCDFILYASKGLPSIQRIWMDHDFISTIFQANLKLWSALIVPELVEMRVPRNLQSFVLK